MGGATNSIHHGKIIAAILVSFAFSLILMQYVFVDKTASPDWNPIQKKADELRSSFADMGARFTGMIARLSVEQAIPTAAPMPTSVPLSPVPSLPAIQPTTVVPTFSLYPTNTPPPKAPTALPSPTSGPRPTPTALPQTPVPTTKPSATPKPQPTTPPPSGVPTFTDPFSQPWYGNGSLRCYAQSQFVKVYANGVTPDSCRKNVQAAIETQLTTVRLLGRTITVHKKAAPAFQAVAAALETYKKDATHYDFPSKKNYEIRNVGAYVFRCNVNASTSGKFDTCSSGCVLSPHAFGIAVDINYDTNQNGSNTYDMPKDVYETFEYYGFRWGGHYPKLGSKIDPMHFEYMVQLCEGI